MVQNIFDSIKALFPNSTMVRVNKSNFLCVPNEDGTYTKIAVGGFSTVDTARSQAFDFATAKDAYAVWAAGAAERAAKVGNSVAKASAEASRARTAERLATMENWLATHELVHATATEVAQDATFDGWGNLMVGSILSKMEKAGQIEVAKEGGKKYYSKV